MLLYGLRNRSKLFCVFPISKILILKIFHRGNRVGLFIWENFQPSYRDPGWTNRDFGNRAIPGAFSHEHVAKDMGSDNEERSR